MTLNEALIRQNFLSQVVLKNNDNELEKGTKVSVMKTRIELNKLRTEFDEDCQKAVEELKTEEFNTLLEKQDRTEEEEKTFLDLNNQLQEEYNAYLVERGKEEVTFDKKFTEEEYFDIVNVNTNEVEINGNKIPAEDFLEIFYTLFVE